MKRFLILVLVCIFYTISGSAQYIAFPNYAIYNPPENPREVPVKGSPLLFDLVWAHAKVVTENNEVIQNDSLFFNFNKLNQNLLLTGDYRKIYEVDKREFKSVTFYWHDSVYIFERVYLINNRDFFQELIRDENKYSLYKLINVRITPVSWHSNGLVSQGNMYAQYADIPVYYVIFPSKEYRVLNAINKKSIERAFRFTEDSKKVEDWLSGNKTGKPGEEDLWKLILYLNG